MTFQEKIVLIRKSRRLTQEAFARMLGVTRQSVYLWEKGLSYPEASKLLEIRRLFGVSIDSLLDDSLDLPAPVRFPSDGKAPAPRPAPAPVKKPTKPASEESEEAAKEDLTPKIDETPVEPLAKSEVEPAEPEPPTPVKAPMRVKVAPTRQRTGSILDVVGSWLRKRK